jgi:hypothetical protein
MRAIECGFGAFAAAEELGLILDRSAEEWAQQSPDDARRARDIMRAALISVIALIGSEGSTAAARMESRMWCRPTFPALREALRSNQPVPEAELLTWYADATREESA